MDSHKEINSLHTYTHNNRTLSRLIKINLNELMTIFLFWLSRHIFRKWAVDWETLSKFKTNKLIFFLVRRFMEVNKSTETALPATRRSQNIFYAILDILSRDRDTSRSLTNWTNFITLNLSLTLLGILWIWRI